MPLYSLPAAAAAAAVALATCLHTAGVHAAPSQAQTHESASASATPVSAEQRQVASFVAKKYRLAVDEVQEFVAHAYHAASEFRLDPLLVLAIVSIESSFDPNARSPKGAQGLMQVLTRVHTDKFEPFGGPRAAFDPLANLKVGSQILKDYLVREGGSIERALKSYVGAAMLPHDYGYGRKVLSERERLAKAAGVKTPPGKSLQAKAEPEEAAPVEKEAAKKERRSEEKLVAKAPAAQPGPEVGTAPAAPKDERASDAGAGTASAAAGTVVAASPDAGKVIPVAQPAPTVAAAGSTVAGAAAVTEASSVTGVSSVPGAGASARRVPAPDVVHVSTTEALDVSVSDAAAAKGSAADAADAAAADPGATDAGASDTSVTSTSTSATGASAIEAPAVPAAPSAAAPEALPALAAASTAADLVPAFTARDDAQQTELQPRLVGTAETLAQDAGSPTDVLLELGDFAEL